jgi:hypothetical protein
VADGHGVEAEFLEVMAKASADGGRGVDRGHREDREREADMRVLRRLRMYARRVADADSGRLEDSSRGPYGSEQLSTFLAP